MLKTYRPSGLQACSLIKLSGPDSQDFLHRITTVHVRAMQPGHGGPGCLLTPQGRFRAFFHLWCVAPDDYAIEVENGRGGHWRTELLAAIDQYTFAEKITLQEQPDLQCVWVFGAPAPLPGAAYAFSHPASETGDSGLTWQSVWAVDIGTWLSRVASGATPLSDSELELARLRALRPRLDHEITTAANPLELGMRDAVAENKGCYPGQEVIEKIVALGAPARRLVRIEGHGPAPSEGTPVSANGVEAGTVTSSVAEGAGYLALAVVRKTHAQAGLELSLPDSRTASITGISVYV